MYGARVVQEIFEQISHLKLAGSIIWEPMIAGDDLVTANVQQKLFEDNRVEHFWDAGKILGKLVSDSLLENTPTAWDIYLLYQLGAKWVGEKFPAPDFWMHQLGEDETLRLNPEVLKRKVITTVNLITN